MFAFPVIISITINIIVTTSYHHLRLLTSALEGSKGKITARARNVTAARTGRGEDKGRMGGAEEGGCEETNTGETYWTCHESPDGLFCERVFVGVKGEGEEGKGEEASREQENKVRMGKKGEKQHEREAVSTHPRKKWIEREEGRKAMHAHLP